MTRIAIIGSGLAGSACGYIFHQLGYETVLFEAGEEIAHGASGNSLGIYNPRLSAEWTYEAQFYAAGFELAIRTLKELPDIDFISHGSLHLVTTQDKQRRFSKMKEHWPWPEEAMQYVSAEKASHIAGVELPYEAIYLPHSGMVSPQKLCRALTRNCEVRLSTPVHDLYQEGAGWRVNEEFFDVVILACGPAIKSFAQTDWLPVHTVRGQVVRVTNTAVSQKLQCNLCFGGYITPCLHHSHMVGSSFQKWLEHTDVLEEDNWDILARLHAYIPALSSLEEVVSARAALRTSSQDRLPIIGSLTEKLPNLYLSAAHGSHGIVTSLIAAHIIASEINELSAFPFAQSVHPGRFIERARRRKQSLPSFLG